MAPALSVHLDVATGRPMDGPATVLVTVTVRNDGDEPLDAQVATSVLLVDGESWPNWGLAIGNGTVDPLLYELPPGEEASAARELDASRLPDGAELVVEVQGVRSNVVVLPTARAQ